ncbi:MAG: DUF4065 domain-containing protein [Lachnospiraceae bacterium]|nr:DUF4065 domain-containing protein [Lachnospiraceae bacterium]
MEDLKNVASYICNRYSDEFGTRIDEMKLHKLLYFAQRESLIQNKEPLFKEVFYGWKFGPVLKEIRGLYREDAFYDSIPEDVEQRIRPVMDKIFSEYAIKDSWNLSTLTHGELAWKNSRIGVSDYDNSDNPMSVEDIKKDAARIRERRELLKKFGFAKR